MNIKKPSYWKQSIVPNTSCKARGFQESRWDFLNFPLGKEQIICQKGKCFETESIETELDSLFDDSNIVDQIQKDLMKNAMA